MQSTEKGPVLQRLAVIGSSCGRFSLHNATLVVRTGGRHDGCVSQPLALFLRRKELAAVSVEETRSVLGLFVASDATLSLRRAGLCVRCSLWFLAYFVSLLLFWLSPRTRGPSLVSPDR